MPQTGAQAQQTQNVAVNATDSQARIENIEKILQGMQEQKTEKVTTVPVTVADMNAMYANHLQSMSFMICFVTSAAIFVGAVSSFFGYKTIKRATQNKVDEAVKKETEKIKTETERITKQAEDETKAAIESLKEKYENVIKEQERQDIKLQIEQHRSQAYNYLSKEQYKEAFKEFDKVIALDPHHVGDYNNRGLVKLKLGQYDAAIKDFNKAIDIDPNFAPTHYNMACFYCLIGRPAKQVLKELAVAIKLDEFCKRRARTDDDFKSIRDNLEFRKLVGVDEK